MFWDVNACDLSPLLFSYPSRSWLYFTVSKRFCLGLRAVEASKEFWLLFSRGLAGEAKRSWSRQCVFEKPLTPRREGDSPWLRGRKKWERELESRGSVDPGLALCKATQGASLQSRMAGWQHLIPMSQVRHTSTRRGCSQRQWIS